MLKFSVVIPCYRDEEKLANLLAQLFSLPCKPYEIIVVDAANSDICEQICLQFQVRRMVSEPCRGQQLRIAATQAAGDVLWFLHADAQLSTDPLTAMANALAQGALGGYFRFRFAAPRDWPAWILEPAIALRCRFGVPYGDQGIFIVRSIYHQIGGHAPWPLFEEVPLVRAARQAGKFVPLAEPIFVDPRRWQRDGWWQRTWHNRCLALNFARGVTPQQLASRYHSKKDA
ncbi:MAG TPA: TIGR04283 family arsenosugar biosynthesis glycosyltransferase [Nitrosomonas sp.]|jgi:rSAM/selenodomain-associated transferase 2|nr:TIGR04283 family arsenosugar biosynthesis glycosyltransferase [Nitrosomonas sp.]HQV87644.1 TIGR04283 family arsenosugar biosynthesis glycosyltransferase [Nitrosomonas sp.]HRB97431.1 TIGR04283 family arsenosugar biosynthesis glycosyltransferase [Nitrosomonas sp.]